MSEVARQMAFLHEAASLLPHGTSREDLIDQAGALARYYADNPQLKADTSLARMSPDQRQRILADAARRRSSPPPASPPPRNGHKRASPHTPPGGASSHDQNLACHLCRAAGTGVKQARLSGGDKGPILCCDGCHKGAHLRCAGLTAEPPAGEEWHCGTCGLRAEGGDGADVDMVDGWTTVQRKGRRHRCPPAAAQAAAQAAAPTTSHSNPVYDLDDDDDYGADCQPGDDDACSWSELEADTLDDTPNPTAPTAAQASGSVAGGPC